MTSRETGGKTTSPSNLHRDRRRKTGGTIAHMYSRSDRGDLAVVWSTAPGDHEAPMTHVFRLLSFRPRVKRVSRTRVDGRVCGVIILALFVTDPVSAETG